MGSWFGALLAIWGMTMLIIVIVLISYGVWLSTRD